MIDHARELKARGVPFVVDPGQGLPMFDGPELLALLEGATLYVVNDYEWAMTRDKIGLEEQAIAERVGALVITQGERGSRLVRGGQGSVVLEEAVCEVAPVAAEQVVDPTGCGDSYRAGLLYALHHGRPLELGARLGSLFGALKIASPGPQSIPLDPARFRECYEREFGESY